MSDQHSSKISFVVPVYNEEESLNPLFDELLKVGNSIGSFECVFVNDCSNDRSKEIINGFKKQYADLVQTIHLDQRSGQTFAMRQGIDRTKGSVICTLDADLQNDPNDIPRMMDKLKENYDCVCGWRKNRQDKPIKAFFSKFGNILQRSITGLTIHDVSCTLRVFNRNVADKIALNREGQHRFIPLSLALQGYKVGEIVSNHRQRQYGYTKYSHKRFVNVVLDFFRMLKSKGKK